MLCVHNANGVRPCPRWVTFLTHRVVAWQLVLMNSRQDLIRSGPPSLSLSTLELRWVSGVCNSTQQFRGPFGVVRRQLGAGDLASWDLAFGIP